MMLILGRKKNNDIYILADIVYNYNLFINTYLERYVCNHPKGHQCSERVHLILIKACFYACALL